MYSVSKSFGVCKPHELHQAVCISVCVVLQSSKLQSLYSETQSLLEESDARVKQLSGELTTAQQEAEKLRKEMRTLQVGKGVCLGVFVCVWGGGGYRVCVQEA